MISNITHTRYNWCQKWDGSIELLDVRQNCVVSASFYENGAATDVRTHASQDGCQPGKDKGKSERRNQIWPSGNESDF
jgi:hypothetical protein